MSDFKQVEAYLPEVVKEMVAIIGFPATERVIKQFGGVSFSFSLGQHYFPRLVEVIGVELAHQLRTHFKSEWLYIPRCETALRVLRNRRFQVEFHALKQQKQISANLAMLELCPKYGISERHGWAILAQAPINAQPSLF